MNKMLKYKTKLMIKSAKKDNWQFGFVDATSESGDQVLINYMDQLLVGETVWTLDGEGNETAVPDGVYSGGGKKITVVNSVVSAIEDVADEPQVEFATETEGEDAKEDTKDEYVTKTEFADFVTYVDEVLGVINEKIDAFSVQTEKFASQLEDALKTSTAKKRFIFYSLNIPKV